MTPRLTELRTAPSGPKGEAPPIVRRAALAGRAGRSGTVAARVVAAFCLAWVVLGGSRELQARADNPDPGKAEELIRQANDMRRHGHDERALPMFRKAYEIARSARTAGQLGLCEMALGYWAAAEGHLDEALAETRNPWVEKSRATLDNALRTAQSHLAELRVEGKPDGAEVVVNGTVVGTLPLANPVRVNEGRVTLEVRAPGRRTMSESLSLAGHATERVQVSLDREESATTSAQTGARVVAPSTVASEGEGGRRKSADSPSEDSDATGRRASRKDSAGDDQLPTWRRVLPWALLGGAVVSGSIGIWQHLYSQNAQSSFDAIAGCGASSPNRGVDGCAKLYEDFEVGRTRAYVGYGIAGVLGAGAITLFILNANYTPSPAAAASAGDGHLSVSVGPASALFTYAARF